MSYDISCGICATDVSEQPPRKLTTLTSVSASLYSVYSLYDLCNAWLVRLIESRAQNVMVHAFPITISWMQNSRMFFCTLCLLNHTATDHRHMQQHIFRDCCHFLESLSNSPTFPADHGGWRSHIRNVWYGTWYRHLCDDFLLTMRFFKCQFIIITVLCYLL